MTAVQTFDIPAGPLDATLTGIARQSGQIIAIQPGQVQGLKAPAIRGRMSAEQAYRKALEHSGLEVFTSDSGALNLRRAPSAGVTTLPAVTVSTPRTNDPDALPAPYAGGQVATGGHLGFLGIRRVMDTSFNTVNYTQQLIQDQQAESITDVLVNNNPSFRIDFPSNGLATSFNVRGNNAGDVAYDGLYGIGTPGIESIERVEVLVGANALLNGLGSGSGGVGAYINQVPKKALEKPVTDLTFGYYGGQFGGRVDVGRRYGPDGQFGIRFNGAYHDGNTEVYNQRRKAVSGAVSMDWRNLDNSVRLSTNFGYRESDTYSPTRTMFLYPNSSFKIPSPPRKNWQNSWLYDKNRLEFATARAEVDITPDVTAYAAVGGSELHDEELFTNSYIMDSKGDLLQQHVYWPLYRNSVTAETGVRGKLQTGAVKHNWSVALSGFRQNYGITETTLLPLNASNLYNPVYVAKPSIAGLPDSYHQPLTTKTQLYGLALADTMSVLDDRVQVTVGLRDQGIDTTNYSTTGAQPSLYKKTALTPAVGLVVRPVQNLSLYANYIEGLQQGQVVPAGYSNAGRSLAPFVSKQYEIGAKYDFGKLTATLDAYQIKTPNAEADGTAYNVSGEQRTRGLELNVYGEVAHDVRLLGGAVLTDAIQTHTAGGTDDGKRVTAVAPAQFNLGAEWDFLPGWTVSGRAIYTGSEYVDAANHQSIPSVTTYDTGLRYTAVLGGHRTDFRFTVENLTNRSYWIGGQGYVMQADPRTFLASVTVHL